MKHFSIILFLILILSSCQESILTDPPTSTDLAPTTELHEGMQRVVASSPEEIKNLISQIGDATITSTRASEIATMSNNEEPFQSLVESNRQKVMASLTRQQLDSIANDPDELEFCPSDSIIADIQFAQLLNADREIQVGRNVYKYLPNGVAYVDADHVEELRCVESETAAIPVTAYNEGRPIQVSSNVNFMPIQYKLREDELRDDSLIGGSCTSGNSSNTNTSTTTTVVSTTNGITLSNGVYIPKTDIRDINYKDGGDGNWLHKTWSGLWGKNIVAIKHFNGHKKLTMNFYDQNYIIYANIGTKLKMQKKVCGIWWNIKADEMIQGWETVTVKYTLPQPVQPATFSYPGMKNPSITTNHPLPFSNENVLLLHIPYIDYDFTTKDLNKAFKVALQRAISLASDYVKKQTKDKDQKMGLLCFNNNESFIIHGPYSTSVKNKKTMESKFYAKWFPGTCSFQFSVGSSMNLKSIKFSTNDGVELYRGSVYGAVKYKGKWLAARITKNS